MPRYPFVLFDADNTLFDFDRAEDRALRLTLSAHGLPADDAVSARYHAINAQLWAMLDRGEATRTWLVVERFARLLAELNLPGDPEALNRAYIGRLGEGADLLPGAEALCRKLAPLCTLAIVTNGSARTQHSRLERSPLRDLIPHLFISQEVGFDKPDPRYFDAVCTALGIAARRQAVVVGDNLGSDILGGINAGIDTVWFNPGGLPRDPAIPPTWEVRDFDALEHVLLP